MSGFGALIDFGKRILDKTPVRLIEAAAATRTIAKNTSHGYRTRERHVRRRMKASMEHLRRKAGW